MNNVRRNFWIDVMLVSTLALTTISLNGPRPEASQEPLAIKTCVHALSAVLMTAGCLFHIVLHRQWLKGVLTGKTKGRMRIKVIMSSAVSVFALLACTSGYVEISSPQISVFHHVTGMFALLGLFVHTIRHLPWMVRQAKRPALGSQMAAEPRSAPLIPLILQRDTRSSPKTRSPAESSARRRSIM